DTDRKWGVEAIAQGDGPPRGREFEIVDILSFIKRAPVRNTLWLTADVHYTAAHYYDPNKAVFQDFEPFWEFVSGPIHAGSFPQNQLDNTFGPQRVYVKAPSAPNQPPSEGLRSRRDRRGDASHDRDAQGPGRSHAVVDHARAEAGVTAPYNEAPTPTCAPPPTAANAWARPCASWSSSTTRSARPAAPRG